MGSAHLRIPAAPAAPLDLRPSTSSIHSSFGGDGSGGNGFRICLPSKSHAVSVFFDSNPKGRTFAFANNSGGRCPPESPSADQVAPPTVERRISWRPERAKGDTYELGVPAEPVRGWYVFYKRSTISHNDRMRKTHTRMISIVSTLTHSG